MENDIIDICLSKEDIEDMSLLIIVLLLSLLFIAINYVVFSMAFKPSKDRDSDYTKFPKSPQYDEVKERSDILTEELEAIPYEEVWIESFDGLRLFGRYYHIKDGAPLQIEAHGYHGTAFRDFCGGNKLARESGFNTLLIDQRSHARSEGRAITFGIKERLDIKAWAEWAASRFGEDVKIVIVGISMGAATVLMASELDLPRGVVGVIADCPYSSPIEIIRKVSNDRRIPWALVKPFVHTSARIFGGFDIKASSPVEAVRNTKLPILLIHGTDDRYVPYQMSVAIRQANPKNIDFLTVERAGHGLSYMIDTDAYESAVKEFLKKVLE